MPGDLSLEPEEQPGQGTISAVPDGNAPVLPSMDVADRRAATANYGLGPVSPGYDKLNHEIANGREDLERANAAEKLSARATNQKGPALIDLASRVVGEITPEHQAEAQNILAAPTDVNPWTVFEKYFGKQYVDDALSKSTNYPAAQMSDIMESESTRQWAQNWVTKQEVARKAQEDSEQYLHDQSLYTKIQSHVLATVPGVQALLQYTNKYDIPGNDEISMIKALWSMPPDEMEEKLSKMMRGLQIDNPVLAAEFSKKVRMYGAGTEYNNIQNAVDASFLLGPAAKLAKLGANKILKTEVSAIARSNTTDNITEKLATLGQTDEAAKSLAQRWIMSPNKDEVGNLKVNIPNNTADIPTRPTVGPSTIDIQEVLPSGLTNMPKSSLGSLTREQGVRIAKATEDTVKSIVEAADKSPQVIRLSPEQRLQAIKDGVEEHLQQFSHIQDGIIDVRVEHATRPNIDYTIVNLGQKSSLEMPGPERILSAAVRDNRDQTIYTGFNHGLAKEKAVEVLGEKYDVTHFLDNNGTTGFFTSKGRYLSRSEALKLVEGSEQVRGKPFGGFIVSEELRGLQNEPTVIMAQRDAKPFTKRQADRGALDNYAQEIYGLKHTQYEAYSEDGKNYYIRVARAVSEKTESVRAIPTNNFSNTWTQMLWKKLGIVRSSAEMSSKAEKANREVAQSAPKYASGVMAQEVHKHIKSQLSSKEFNELQDVFNWQHNQVDFKKGSNVRGKFSDSFLDLQKDYMEVHGRLPTEKETQAYFTQRAIPDTELFFANENLRREMSIRGGEHFTVPMQDGSDSPKFIGVAEKQMPWKSRPRENAGVVIYKDGEYGRTFFRTTKTEAELAEMEKGLEGHTAIRVMSPELLPLKSMFGDAPVHYVITNKYERNILDNDLIARAPGGHVMYTDNHMIVRPKLAWNPEIGMHLYYGDEVISLHGTHNQAEKWAGKLEELRQLMKTTDDKQRIQAFVDANLPVDKDWAKVVRERPDAPFVTSKFGTSSFEAHPDLRAKYPETKMWNLVDQSNPSKGVDKTFMQERSAPAVTMSESGTVSNPVYKLEQAKELSPWEALTRGWNAVFNRNRFMNDYRESAVESWISQFGKALDVPGGLDKIRENPFYYFYYPEYVKAGGAFAEGTKLRINAEAARLNILRFLGMKSDAEKEYEAVISSFIDKMYGKFGENKFTYTMDAALHAIPDAPSLVRKANATAQFFLSPAQIPIQLVSAINPMSIAPLHGAQGLYASFLHGLMALSEKAAIRSYIDKMASHEMTTALFSGVSRMGGWKPGQFQEAFDLFRSSGFNKVGTEMAVINDVPTQALMKRYGIGGVMDKVVTAGYSMMVAPEKIVRQASWYTAYHEWRAANPTKIITNQDALDIGSRAHLMDINMTREANSSLQRGVMSIPMQWGTFAQRLGEQMNPFGRQLTRLEHASQYTFYAGLVGVPAVMGGMTLGIIPFHDLMRSAIQKMAGGQEALEDNTPLKVAMEGPLQVFIQRVTGKEYSMQRLGPNNVPIISDVVQAVTANVFGVGRNKSFFEIIGGAPDSFVERAMKAAHPFLGGTWAALHGKQETWPLTNQDFIDAARLFKGVDTAYNAFQAYNYGKYIDKNGTLNVRPGGVDGTDAVFMAFGFQRQDLIDAWNKKGIVSNEQEYKDRIKPELMETFRRAYTALAEQDFKGFETYATRAKTLMETHGYTAPERDRVFTQASKADLDLVTSANKSFYNAETTEGWKRLKTKMGLD